LEAGSWKWESKYGQIEYLTSIKYKFGIQVPKGIKNAIKFDKKNSNNLCEEAIKTELKQLTNFETFIVLDSG
jgi:hypothetical protein